MAGRDGDLLLPLALQKKQPRCAHVHAAGTAAAASGAVAIAVAAAEDMTASMGAPSLRSQLCALRFERLALRPHYFCTPFRRRTEVCVSDAHLSASSGAAAATAI